MQQQALRTLKDWFGTDIPDPKQTIVTRWQHDEFSKGSYSYNAEVRKATFERDGLVDKK